ncbi:MAG TPA: UDP-N-acetylmuramoyl-L-alanine--D-glutamate ligase [Chthoniobacterales bacterium]|jgi:UDP-N-acetylmuramoylalanine--D-glutamate ligase|nr:UDP-N-acetylmuramoyl-L-alanine--D-glutamate ligase [Chthoniobacterales bacterium]
MNLNRTRAAVLGLGTSGEAAARLLQQRGASVTVFDSGKPDAQKIRTLQDLGISIITGEAADMAKADYDLTILSPGIDPVVPLIQNFRRQGAALVGELELAFRFCERPVIAITGTNGKTTTTQLIESMLNSAGYRTVACGNIGMPFAEAVQRQGEFDFFTVEVSSFQLETISTFRPEVALWLNLTPDHLDRYPNMAEYRTAKLRIFENQRSSDYAVTNYSDDLPGLVARQITFSAYSEGADFILQGETICFRGEPILEMKETQLSGFHNAENLMAALGAAHAIHIPWEKAKSGLTNYRLLPHRCERVGEIDGVIYINDSKATNLDALVKALESQPQPVVLIAGGKDKGFAFDAIAGLVHEKVKYAVLIGEMADRIYQGWSKVVPSSCAQTLPAAVDQARQHSIPGGVVLFSPGTSSFDMFKNYADRGNQFREIIQELAR